jgi:DNA-binding response OmpR family regulator
MKTRILVVEDEPTFSEPLAESLGRDGFEAEIAPTLAGAREAFRHDAPDLVLLDVMLPDGDSRDLARKIRKGPDVPIVMLTARGEEIDRVLGLELGADDYVVKPFSARELTARIGAIMRRGRARDQKSPNRHRSAPSRSNLTHRHQGRRIARHGGSRVRTVAPPDGPRRRGSAQRADHGTRSGIPTGSGRPRRSTCTSPGSARDRG